VHLKYQCPQQRNDIFTPTIFWGNFLENSFGASDQSDIIKGQKIEKFPLNDQKIVKKEGRVRGGKEDHLLLFHVLFSLALTIPL
jgi:hypothetical protein